MPASQADKPIVRRKNAERIALVNENTVFETLSCMVRVGSAIRVREEMYSGQLDSERQAGGGRLMSL